MANAAVLRVTYREVLRHARAFDRVPALRFLMARNRTDVRQRDREDLSELYKHACFSSILGPSALVYTPITGCQSMVDLTRLLFRHAHRLRSLASADDAAAAALAATATASADSISNDTPSSPTVLRPIYPTTDVSAVLGRSPLSLPGAGRVALEPFKGLAFDAARWFDCALFFMRCFNYITPLVKLFVDSQGKSLKSSPPLLATEQQLVQLEPGTNKPLIRPGMVLLAHPLTSTNDWQNCVAVLYPTNHQANSADARLAYLSIAPRPSAVITQYPPEITESLESRTREAAMIDGSTSDDESEFEDLSLLNEGPLRHNAFHESLEDLENEPFSDGAGDDSFDDDDSNNDDDSDDDYEDDEEYGSDGDDDDDDYNDDDDLLDEDDDDDDNADGDDIDEYDSADDADDQLAESDLARSLVAPEREADDYRELYDEHGRDNDSHRHSLAELSESRKESLVAQEVAANDFAAQVVADLLATSDDEGDEAEADTLRFSDNTIDHILGTVPMLANPTEQRHQEYSSDDEASELATEEALAGARKQRVKEHVQGLVVNKPWPDYCIAISPSCSLFPHLDANNSSVYTSLTLFAGGPVAHLSCVLARDEPRDSDEVPLMPGAKLVVVDLKAQEHATGSVPINSSSFRIYATPAYAKVAKAALSEMKVLEQMLGSGVKPGQLPGLEQPTERLFYSNLRWTREQLQREIERGGWLVYYPEPHELDDIVLPPYDSAASDADPDYPDRFAVDHWKRVLERIGGEYAVVARNWHAFRKAIEQTATQVPL